MEFEGVVYEILPSVKGKTDRGEWVKQDVVFEMNGEFNRKVCVSFWGDKAADASFLQVGEQVIVSANVESRQSKEGNRWFTEVRAWKMSKPKKVEDIPDFPPFHEPADYSL